eukprot:GEMP01091946.1.p1 GENE.GEMP01091946.1~~GEMP01091946.1.p1  ORF type:complete len:233 (+),score=44.60 GEMP01091946.1:116-814(+)
MISSRTGTRDSTRSRTNATAPSKEDLHVWGNIADPPMMRESPVTSTLLIVALVAISLTSLLFGLLAYAGPWCSCGRKCPVPTSLPNAVMPLCHNETELDHGKMCDLECNIGYTPSTGRFLCVDGGLSPPSAEDTTNNGVWSVLQETRSVWTSMVSSMTHLFATTDRKHHRMRSQKASLMKPIMSLKEDQNSVVVEKQLAYSVHPLERPPPTKQKQVKYWRVGVPEHGSRPRK